MSTAPAISPDFASAFRDLMVQAVAQEVETTKKVLAAVPDDRSGYSPAPKCRTGRELAWHIAKEDVLFLDSICEGRFDFADNRYEDQAPATTAEMASWYDVNIHRALDNVRALTPQQLTERLDFMGMVTLPRYHFLMLMNSHSIHHRGQLSAYLRPMGAKVPGIYGPSADTE